MKAPTAALPFVLLLLLCLSSPPPSAAQEPAGEFEELIEVTEVLLDVLVLDRDGEPVAGLGPADFEVRSQGQPVEITSATFYSTRYDETGAAVGDTVPASRYFVFFFHDLRREAAPGNQLMRAQLDAGRRSREWVETEMGPSDWVAVASYDVKLKLHQDFTQDQGALVAAIEDAAAGRSPEPRREVGRPRLAAEDLSRPTLSARLPAGRDLRDETKTIYDGLELLAEAAGHVVGRKNLMLFSLGWGDTALGPTARPDPRYYPGLLEALNANNVAVYPIDMTPRETRNLQSDFLHTLAEDTGGRFYELFTNFLVPLREIAGQATGYYLLGFRAEHRAGESGYREIEVDVARKGLEVRAPEGYRYGY